MRWRLVRTNCSTIQTLWSGDEADCLRSSGVNIFILASLWTCVRVGLHDPHSAEGEKIPVCSVDLFIVPPSGETTGERLSKSFGVIPKGCRSSHFPWWRLRPLCPRWARLNFNLGRG